MQSTWHISSEPKFMIFSLQSQFLWHLLIQFIVGILKVLVKKELWCGLLRIGGVQMLIITELCIISIQRMCLCYRDFQQLANVWLNQGFRESSTFDSPGKLIYLYLKWINERSSHTLVQIVSSIYWKYFLYYSFICLLNKYLFY